jgi:hypothetical protein
MVPLGPLALSLALYFEPAPASFGLDAKYVAVSTAYTVALSDTGVTLLPSSGGRLTMVLPRARPVEVEERQIGVSNYYAGPDRSVWRTGVPHFGRARYHTAFPGVDLIVYGNGSLLEYDWIVSPGSDPSRIHFGFQGCSGASIEPDGDLVLRLPGGGEVRHRRPAIYQVVNGTRRVITGGFVQRKDKEFGFRIEEFDRSRPLIIDPTLIFASGFGGNPYVSYFPPYPGAPDGGTGIAVDGMGNIYVTGYSDGSGFPLVNGIGPVPPTCTDPGFCAPSWQFVSKISPDGRSLIYSTFVAHAEPLTDGSGFLGPAFNAYDLPTGRSLAVDSSGIVYVTGSTTGSNFPSLNGKPTVTAGGHDAFVLKLNPAGQLAGSMLLGGQGDDLGNCLALGADGALYLTGVTTSSNFPTTAGVYRTQPPSMGFNVFLAKINPAAIGNSTTSAVIYSTYLEPGLAPLVTVDVGGNAYVAIPTGLESLGTPGSFQSVAPPKNVPLIDDILIAKINATGTRLLYATYFDGSGHDYANGLAVDTSGSVYLSGTTTSPDLPTTSGSLQPNAPATLSYPAYGYSMGFLAKFSPDATSLTYSTYLGGTGGYDYGFGLAVDSSGNAYVGGSTESADFPIHNGIQVSLENSPCPVWSDPSSFLPAGYQYCGSAGTLTVVNPQGNAIVWSTFLGYGLVADVALDSAGNVYATGIGIVLQGRHTCIISQQQYWGREDRTTGDAGPI